VSRIQGREVPCCWPLVRCRTSEAQSTGDRRAGGTGAQCRPAGRWDWSGETSPRGPDHLGRWKAAEARLKPGGLEASLVSPIRDSAPSRHPQPSACWILPVKRPQRLILRHLCQRARQQSAGRLQVEPAQLAATDCRGLSGRARACHVQGGRKSAPGEPGETQLEKDRRVHRQPHRSGCRRRSGGWVPPRTPAARGELVCAGWPWWGLHQRGKASFLNVSPRRREGKGSERETSFSPPSIPPTRRLTPISQAPQPTATAHRTRWGSNPELPPTAAGSLSRFHLGRNPWRPMAC